MLCLMWTAMRVSCLGAGEEAGTGVSLSGIAAGVVVVEDIPVIDGERMMSDAGFLGVCVDLKIVGVFDDWKRMC